MTKKQKKDQNLADTYSIFPEGNRFKNLEDANAYMDAIRKKSGDPMRFCIPRYVVSHVGGRVSYHVNPEWTDAAYEEAFVPVK